jgi:hypothetical protein
VGFAGEYGIVFTVGASRGRRVSVGLEYGHTAQSIRTAGMLALDVHAYSVGEASELDESVQSRNLGRATPRCPRATTRSGVREIGGVVGGGQER